MSIALALALTLSAAPPATRLSYEAKCLYCHSETVAESRRLSEGQWRRLIETMRLKAPLLITRSDVAPLARFMVHTLQLGARTPAVSRPAPVEPQRAPEATAPQEELPVTPQEEPQVPEAPPPSDAQVQLEREASALIERRCSKCHTLGRVYGRLDTLERSLTTLERMRLKTGSGLTAADAALLERYLRSQF